MATDLSWDPVNRDLNFTSDGNIAVNENCSTQNGGVILEGRVFNIAQCQYGIGFNSQVLGGPKSQAALQLNRWVSQCISDGALGANWQPKAAINEDFSFIANVNYQ